MSQTEGCPIWAMTTHWSFAFIDIFEKKLIVFLYIIFKFNTTVLVYMEDHPQQLWDFAMKHNKGGKCWKE